MLNASEIPFFYKRSIMSKPCAPMFFFYRLKQLDSFIHAFQQFYYIGMHKHLTLELTRRRSVGRSRHFM